MEKVNFKLKHTQLDVNQANLFFPALIIICQGGGLNILARNISDMITFFFSHFLQRVRIKPALPLNVNQGAIYQLSVRIKPDQWITQCRNIIYFLVYTSRICLPFLRCSKIIF